MEQHAEDSANERLAALVGEWSMVAELEGAPPADSGARIVFEWMPGKRFLLERWEVPALDPLEMPAAGIAVIGADPESEGGFLRHYFDSRGVARIYKMAVGDRSGTSGGTRRISRRWTSRSATRAPSATMARPSPERGRFATTARPGSTTSI